MIQDLDGNRTGSVHEFWVKTDHTAPALSSAAVNGTALTLTYDEALHREPAASSFTVKGIGADQTPSAPCLSPAGPST